MHLVLTTAPFPLEGPFQVQLCYISHAMFKMEISLNVIIMLNGSIQQQTQGVVECLTLFGLVFYYSSLFVLASPEKPTDRQGQIACPLFNSYNLSSEVLYP